MPVLLSVPLNGLRISVTAFEADLGELLQVQVAGAPTIIMRAISYPSVGMVAEGMVDLAAGMFLDGGELLNQAGIIVGNRIEFRIRDPAPSVVSNTPLRAGHVYLPRGPDALACLAVTMPDASVGFLLLNGQNRGKVTTPKPDIYLGLLEMELVEQSKAS